MTTLAATEPLVRIRDLRYRYAGAASDVLRIPFLDIPSTGLTAVTGPSGAGKSTLVELLAGTLREPYDGSIEVLGEEWKELRRDADRQRHLRRVGLIPQDFGLLPARTPRETLLQDLADAEVARVERERRVEAALDAVALAAHADRAIAGLSGGQRQRVAIARMLARDVDLVIADEPTANLDPGLVASTLALFGELARRVPVVVVTHDPDVARQCDRTVILQTAVGDPAALPAVPELSVAPGSGLPGQPLYPAPLGRRLAAFGLDRLVSLVLLADAVVVAAIVGRIVGWGGSPGRSLDMRLLLAALAGYAVCELAVQIGFLASARAATPGKRALGLAVVDHAGARLSRRGAAVRTVAMAATLLTFGLGSTRAGRTGQALHDRIAGTAVVEIDVA